MGSLLEDLVGGLGPHEGVGALVPALDEAAELGVGVLDSSAYPIDGLRQFITASGPGGD